MKVLNLVSIATISILALTACGEEKVRTSQYYTENPSEIKKVQAKCKAENDKGYVVEGALKENCRNARVAESKLIRAAIG